MSVKLRNGLILRNRTLEQAFEILKQVRQTCLPQMQQALVASAAEVLVFEADLPLNFREFKRPLLTIDDIPNLIFEARRDVLSDNGTRSDDWDYSFTVALFPKGPDVLARHHNWNDPGYVEALMQAGFEDYHYHNQTDCTAGVSQEEWRQRHADWRALDFGCRGLNFEVIEWRDIQDYDHAITSSRIREALPDEEQRRKRVARHLAHYVARKPLLADGEEENGDQRIFQRAVASRSSTAQLYDNILSLPFLNS